MSDYYDVAQICTNGHVITGNSMEFPQHKQKFCSKCGASINGNVSGTNVGIWNDLPLHCHECGKPYPWTDAILKAAQELADMADNLTDGEREELKEDIGDLISNAPRAPAAAHRAKALATKAGIKDGLISIFSNIASDTLVKFMRGW